MAEKGKDDTKKRKPKRKKLPGTDEGRIYNVEPAEEPVKGPTGKDVYRS
jgi:hypothetical protein